MDYVKWSTFFYYFLFYKVTVIDIYLGFCIIGVGDYNSTDKKKKKQNYTKPRGT